MLSTFSRCLSVVSFTAAACAQPAPATAPDNANRPITVGVYGGTNNATVAFAIANGIDVLYPAINWYQDHDYLKNIVETCRPHGIKVVPSYAVGSDLTNPFAAEHPEWYDQRRDGSRLDEGHAVSLSFGVPEVRQHKVETLTRRVRDYGLDGLMLDYTRLYDQNCGYHESIVNAFKKQTGRDPMKIPNDDPRWVQFRADVVTGFVRELRESLNALAAERGRPVEVWACVNPDPIERRDLVYQDWQAWVDRGLIDGVVSMIYERDTNHSMDRARIANAACAGKVPHVPMIAPYGGFLTSDEMVLDASLKVLRTGTAGVSFYRADTMFGYGVEDAVAQVAQWTPAAIADMPINHALNPGFEFGLERWAVGDGQGVEVVTGHARSGEKSLSISGNATARQLIDRGFIPDARSMHLTMWADFAEWSEGDRLSLDVNVNTVDGGDTYFRVPLTPGEPREPSEPGEEPTDWRMVEARLPLVADAALSGVMLGVSVEGGGEIFIDDLAVRFDASTGGDESLAISESEAARHVTLSGNLARGQVTSASSFWEVGFEPDNAVDGDLNNQDYGRDAAWHSQRPAVDQWLQVHLPVPQRLTSVRLLNASAQSAYRTRDYRLEVSLDGRRFRTVAKGTLPDDGSTWTEVQLKNVPAKFVRFVGETGYNPDYAVGLKEIEIHGK